MQATKAEIHEKECDFLKEVTGNYQKMLDRNNEMYFKMRRECKKSAAAVPLISKRSCEDSLQALKLVSDNFTRSLSDAMKKARDARCM